MPTLLCRRTASLALFAWLAVCAAWGAAPTAWYEGFEGAEVSWRPAGGNASAHVAIHQRDRGQAHTGEWCERFAISAGSGTAVYVVHEVGQPLVIEELLPSVWVKSDRSGLQLLAEVVLPRTLDRRTGRPVSTLLAGTSYTQIGSWQQLRIDDLERALSRQMQVLRAEVGPTADEREAYVERIVLNLYGGPGWTNVWIDDLDIRAHVARTPSMVDAASVPAKSGGGWVPAGSGTSAGAQPNRIRLADAALLIDNRPFFPRLLQHCGEPLGVVRQLGFNGIWLSRPAPVELFREAEQLGLWIVCPPPQAGGANRAAGAANAALEIGSEYDRVLAWHFGEGLDANGLEATRRRIEELRTADRRGSRPMVGNPQAELRAYSRHLDLLVQSARPLGSSLELGDYATWLRTRALLARPGTPFWTTIQTQLAPTASQQLSLLDSSRPAVTQPAVEQLRLLVYAAIAAGSHGLLFESHSPLTADDASTRERALALELLNLELSLAEPWAGNGAFAGTVSANHADVSGALLRAEHKRLLLAAWQGAGSQYVVGPAPRQPVALVIPGLPESIMAYDLLPGGLRPLRRERVSGGTQVVLEEFGLLRPVLLVQEPQVIGVLGRQALAVGPRAAELQRHLAVRKLHVVQEVLGQVGRAVPSVPQINEGLSKAKIALQRCEGQLAAKEWQSTCSSAEVAMSELRGVERRVWEAMVKPLPSPISSPAAISFSTLPWQARLADRLAASRAGENRLPAGNLDDLNAVVAAGWVHVENRVEGVQSSADLTPVATHWGPRGMRLVARAEDEKNLPDALPAVPVSILSPEVQVRQGELLCIRGWVLVREPISASADKLLISDTLCGEALAERIGKTPGWTEFVFYRVAPRYGSFRLSFALCGLGEAYLDDVSIQAVEPAMGGMSQRGPEGPRY